MPRNERSCRLPRPDRAEYNGVVSLSPAVEDCCAASPSCCRGFWPRVADEGGERCSFVGLLPIVAYGVERDPSTTLYRSIQVEEIQQPSGYEGRRVGRWTWREVVRLSDGRSDSGCGRCGTVWLIQDFACSVGGWRMLVACAGLLVRLQCAAACSGRVVL